MKTVLGMALLGVMLWQEAAQGLTLAPGDFANVNGVGIGAGGSVIATQTSDFNEALSDAIVVDTFTTSVLQGPGGLIFRYELLPRAIPGVSQPPRLILTGFQGFSTDVYVLTGAGLESSSFAASRSADGLTLMVDGPAGLGNAFVDEFIVEVRTDATDYALDPTAYMPIYWISPFAPPTLVLEPFLQPFPTEAFAPSGGFGAAPVPEPAAAAMLALAVGGLAVRLRSRR